MPTFRVWHLLLLGMGAPMAALWAKHLELFGAANPVAAALILFLVVNVVICVWELALAYRHDLIMAVYEKRCKDGPVRGVGGAAASCWLFVGHGRAAGG